MRAWTMLTGTISILVGCGGARGPAPALPTPPDTVLAAGQPRGEPPLADEDSLLAEYLTRRGGRRYEVAPMHGDVRCYGGPALDGNLPVEVYVRRGADGPTLVEDRVELYPDDLALRRRTLTLRRGTDGVASVDDPAGDLRGQALMDEDGGAATVQVLEQGSGAVELLAQAASEKTLQMVSLALDPAAAKAGGVRLDELSHRDGWEALRVRLVELAEHAAVLTIKGTLPAIATRRCEAIFARFPPPR
jgi:hypothetical protein